MTLALWLAGGTPVAAQCTGDCDENGRVVINELVSGVNIALARTAIDSCESFDVNADRRVAVNELVAAVNNALLGCRFAGRYFASVPLDAGSTGEITLLASANRQIAGTLSLLEPAAQRQGLGSSGILSGQFDPALGSFEVTGSVPGPSGPIAVRLSGQLGAGFVLEIGGRSYSGAFAPRPAASPTPTPTPGGTTRAIRVGQSGLPFDPEVLEIDPGDTVEWVWVGGTHSVRAANLDGIGQPSCVASGLFDSGPRSSGSFTYRFTEPGRYAFHCGVPGHCASFESGYVEVRGPATPTPTRTSTPSHTVSIPTPTITPQTIGGVSVRMLGFFSGTALIGTQSLATRLQVLVDDGGPLVIDVGEIALLFPNPVRMSVVSPTQLSYEVAGPPPTSFSLSLDARGHLVGRFAVNDPIMPRLPTDYDLVREQ